MAFIDYYKILGIDKNAAEKDIKAAYRKLARKFHPDLNPNDTEANKKFQQMFGGAGSGRSRQQAKYRGQDFTAELHLTLREAAETHKQTLTVNGKQIRITIPAGVEDGQTIKIPGHGGPGSNGGPAGDLYITFAIANDHHFKRTGA